MRRGFLPFPRGRGPLALLMMVTSLGLAAVGCAAEPEPDPTQDVSGNQPICVEAQARVSALCKGAQAPSFESTCSGRDHCRAGCVYDHPCDASAQTKCAADRGC